MQIILVSCRGRPVIHGKELEHDELFPVTWHCPASQNPPMYLIAVSAKAEIEILRQAGCFVVNFIPFELAAATIKCARSIHLHHTDKWRDAGLTKGQAEKIDAPLVKEAAGWLECQLAQEIQLGDHMLFIGRVLNSVLEKKFVKRLFHLEGEKFTTTLD
ncbi:MAG: flavin reductase family protein [Candidatus Woesearchaeota archaeon]